MLRGELDGHAAPQLDAVLQEAAALQHRSETPGTVTLEFAGVPFVYLRGIAVLQAVFERLTVAGWQISLANATPNVADLLAIARQHQSLMPTGHTAVTGFPAPAPSKNHVR